MTVPNTTPGTIVRRLAAISALAFAVSFLSAPLASAGSNERIDVKYGYVRFDSEGEKLAAADIWANHVGIRAKLTLFKDGKKKVARVTDSSAGYESSKNFSIREGTTVFLQLCYVRDGAEGKCSRAHRAEA